MLCSVSCHKTKVVFHISVESNQFSFELVQHVQPVTFFIIGLAGFCSCKQKPIKIKKTNDSCTFSKPFLPQAVICIMVKNNTHKSHQIFHDTLSVYHLANVISDTNLISEYVSVSIDVNDVEDLAPTFLDLEQRLQVNRATL